MRSLAALLLSLILPAAHGAEVQGTLDWARVAGVGTPVSGRVEAVAVEPGQRVDEGQVLVTLDPRPFRIHRDRAQARVDGAAPRRAEAEREKERAEELYDQALLSDHERELARIGYAEADAAYREARAELERARLHQEYATVRAPFAGVVEERRVHPGETVVNGVEPQVLVELADLGRLRISAEADAAVASRVRPGSEVTVTADGTRYSARVVRVAPLPASGRYLLEADFAVDDALPLWGQPAELNVP